MPLIFSFIGVGIVVASHAVATVWWAGTLTAQLGHVVSRLDSIKDELEKRDTQISAVWKKLDETREYVFKNVKVES